MPDSVDGDAVTHADDRNQRLGKMTFVVRHKARVNDVESERRDWRDDNSQ